MYAATTVHCLVSAIMSYLVASAPNEIRRVSARIVSRSWHFELSDAVNLNLVFCIVRYIINTNHNHCKLLGRYIRWGVADDYRHVYTVHRCPIGV